MIEVAIEAAKKGAEVALGYFETELEHEIKDDKSFVTKADRDTEAIIIETLKAKFPDHAFLGEESGETGSKSEYLWVIDPIDGTSNFVNGVPVWGVSVALVKNNEPICGVIINPVMNLLVHAERGKGLWCNGARLQASTQGKDTAMISAGVGQGPGIKDKLLAIFRENPKYLKSYRYLGSAVLELELVARGGTEGFISLGLSKWDYAAGALLVQEGGGMITDLRGNPWKLEENYFIASNGVIHPEMLEVIRAAGII